MNTHTAITHPQGGYLCIAVPNHLNDKEVEVMVNPIEPQPKRADRESLLEVLHALKGIGKNAPDIPEDEWYLQ